MNKFSLPKNKINILLVEDIHQNAVGFLKQSGYGNIIEIDEALDEAELMKLIADVHILGIRSRTQLTQTILRSAKKLMAIGCFCIGTNQVDALEAKMLGIPVFNAPYSNTRSVAELVLAEIIFLFRRIAERTWLAHTGVWNKSASNSYEIRGKVLGIIGYGHIGAQLSVLAEGLGMRVVFYDIQEKLVLGNAQRISDLSELLSTADVVSLHVPATELTNGLMDRKKLMMMKRGAYLINASRGNVVDIRCLAELLKQGVLGGAAIDVFPQEPSSESEVFNSPLRGIKNVILTPHIGGSTIEAQENIGFEVADKLVRYSDNGSTLGVTNFVEVVLPSQENSLRFMHIHRDIPGVLQKINSVFSTRQINISAQYLRTDGEIGYVVTDVSGSLEIGMGIRKDLASIDGTVRTRFLY